MRKQSIAILDILGISSASLCLAHCFLFPILSVIPFGLSHNHWVDVFFVCIGMFVVSKILHSEASKKVKIILTVSLSIVLVGVVLEIVWQIDTAMVLIGGLGMIIGHFLNFKHHKSE
jgi:asparagine N-glycosylation enzyme membrane subunit Stt3